MDSDSRGSARPLPTSVARARTIARALLWLGLAGFVAAASAGVPPPPQESWEQLVARGSRALHDRRFAQATGAYREALAREPKSQDAREGLVRALLGTAALEEAVETARSFTVSEPDARSFTLLGDALYRAARFDDAKTAYSSALAAGESARAYLGLGRLFRSEASRLSAKAHLQRAYELAPEDPDVLLEWIGQLEDAAARAEMCRKYLELVPAGQSFHAGWVAAERALALRGDDETWQVEGGLRALSIPLLRERGPAHSGHSLRTVIEARINGGRKLRLLLDTGASGVILTKRSAKRCGLRPLAEVSAAGAGDKGPREGFVAIADSVQIGDLKFRNADVGVFDRGPDGLDGSLGPGVFDQFLIRIDFPSSVLSLEPLPPLADVTSPDDWTSFDRNIPPALKHFTSIRVFNGHIFVPGQLNERVATQFLVDSGAQQTFASLAVAARAGQTTAALGITIYGMSGPVAKVRQLRDVTLQVAQFRQKVDALLAFDTSETDELAGFAMGVLLGRPFLDHLVVTIDYRDGLMHLRAPFARPAGGAGKAP